MENEQNSFNGPSKVNRYGIIFKEGDNLFVSEYLGNNEFSDEQGIIGDKNDPPATESLLILAKVESNGDGVRAIGLALMELEPAHDDGPSTVFEALNHREARQDLCEKIEEIIADYEKSELWHFEKV